MELYREMVNMITEYIDSLKDVGFARYDLARIDHVPENEEELLEAFKAILMSSKELNYILEESPNSFFVCDAEARCIRVNKKFSDMTRMSREDVLGAKMSEKNADGSFRPSVCYLTLKEGRSVSALQEIGDVSGMAVTGVPVRDESGNLFRIVTNAIKIDEVSPIAEYFNEKNHAGGGAIKENGKIIAESGAMQQVLKMADMVKDTESNILITGETGVGKGVLVKYIHETSGRSEKPLVSINCGAIPENLLESELFGYEGGAFTGADSRGKPGLIELAEGGTLFLDEISELPLMLQVKILHFLQTKKMMRVGGTKEIMIDTRVIAASNKNLEGEVERGNFRSDLYYRINVIPIYIPPLRDRKRDLMAMAEYFLDFYNAKYRKNVILTEEMAEYVMAHKWPGNVRELENYMERMVVTSVPETTENGEKEGREPHEKMLVVAGYGEKLSDMIEKAEKEAVVEAYRKYKSSYKVAEILGISQSTAYRRIKKFVKDKDE